MKITIDFIKTLNPCKSGINNFETLYPNYNNKLTHLLALDNVSYSDKIWLATKIVNIKILQQWSVECAENVIDNYNSLYPDDTRISDCIQKTKDYINNKCSLDELLAARSAAWSAAESAAWLARSAWSAARSAGSAAESAAESAWLAAESAAWSARSAGSAAWSAAESAAESAGSAAESAAESAAWSAAEKEQEDINLSILIALLENQK